MSSIKQSQILLLFIVFASARVECEYLPNWESLDSRHLPQWYDDAKVGIFIHWGVYSVPNFGDEWFWYHWKTEANTSYEKYMEKHYKPSFSYLDFASEFTAELFNATEWAKLIKQAGAKYVVLTSKHHDGFALWPSTYSGFWNSFDIGPHIDIVGELSSAIRDQTNITFGLYYSLYEWYNRLYKQDKTSRFRDRNYVQQKVIPELQELIKLYQPEIIWSDGDWEASENYWGAKEFIAWLYNESPVNETVVVNDRWGLTNWCRHGDFFNCVDRYNPGVLKTHKWENAFTIDKEAWKFRENIDASEYLTSGEIIKEIVSTVSCGGNALVGIGPTRFGNIPTILKTKLMDMGSWLSINGESIYKTIPWKFQNDTTTSGIWFTAIKEKYEEIVFAIVLEFPYDTYFVDIYRITPFIKQDTEISMLGYPRKIMWYVRGDAVRIKMPDKADLEELGLEFAWTFKLSFLLNTDH